MRLCSLIESKSRYHCKRNACEYYLRLQVRLLLDLPDSRLLKTIKHLNFVWSLTMVWCIVY